MGTEMKRTGREADSSHPSSAEIKNAWSYNSTHPTSSIAWYLVKYRILFTMLYLVKYRDILPFTSIERFLDLL
jgi:hypothetical protein